MMPASFYEDNEFVPSMWDADWDVSNRGDTRAAAIPHCGSQSAAGDQSENPVPRFRSIRESRGRLCGSGP